MPKFRNVQTNFSGGLLSEGMLGRIDLAQYENGCLQLENWWPKVTGGMRRRPGSVYLNEPAVNAIRIEAFVFNETQTYIFVFCDDDNLRVYDPDTGSLTATVSYSLVSPSALEIRQWSITHTGDVMFLAHEDMLTITITRTSATTFVAAFFVFENPYGTHADVRAAPYVKFADGDVTLAVAGYQEGASVTATASTAYFDSFHVGEIIRYRSKQMKVTAVGGSPSATCTVTILEDLDRGAVLTFNAALHSAQDFDVGEIIVGTTSGIKAEVTAKTNTTITVAMIAGIWPAAAAEEVEGLTTGNKAVMTANTNVNPVANSDWDEAVFNSERGYPAVVEFHSQRLWLAGSSSLPAHIFGSRVAAFYNFDAGDALPADSIQVVLADKQVNKVHDIVSGRNLQIFTDAGEFYAPQSEELPLEPSTFDLRKQTRYGTKRYVEPRVFDESTLFVQATGYAIREFIWVDSSRGYSAEAVSLISEEHISDIVECEVLYGGYDRPEQIAFFVNGDGTITWYHSARNEGIRSWGKWTTQGEYKSLCVILDKLYALVDRDNGVFIERFELDETMDCISEQTSALPGNVWINDAPQLEDMTVQVTSSVVKANHDPDFYLGEYENDGGGGGSFSTAPIDVDNVTIGLGFTQTLETMPIEVKDNQGVTTGMPKRIVSADIYMAGTLAIQLEGQRVLTFQAGVDWSVRPDAITGMRKFYLLGYDERPTLTIVNDVPLPCEALSLGAEVEY